MILLVTMKVSYKHYADAYIEQDFSYVIVWAIFQTTLGFKTLDYHFSHWPLLVIAQLCLIIQLVIHIPFVYYIGKEHLLMAYDEFKNQNLT